MLHVEWTYTHIPTYEYVAEGKVHNLVYSKFNSNSIITIGSASYI